MQSAVDGLQSAVEQTDITVNPHGVGMHSCAHGNLSSDRSLGRSSSFVRRHQEPIPREAPTAGAHEEAEGDSHCLMCTKNRVLSPAPAIRGIDGQVYLLPPANIARPISAVGLASLAHGSHSSPTASRARPSHVRGISSSSPSAFQESAAVTTPLPVCLNGGPSQQPQSIGGCVGSPLGHGSRGSWPRKSSRASSGHASRPASASRTQLQREASGNLHRLHAAHAATS
jgi:hypothetical protein